MTRVQPSTATHDKYGFPLEPCERCGGSGHHAYCETYGTVCFGCGGKGRRRTAAAEREYRKWGEAVIAAQTTRTTDVKVGELMWASPDWGTKMRWWKVVNIVIDPAGAVSDGVPMQTVTFTLERRGVTRGVTHCGPDTTVRINRGESQPKPDEYIARAINKEESKK